MGIPFCTASETGWIPIKFDCWVPNFHRNPLSHIGKVDQKLYIYIISCHIDMYIYIYVYVYTHVFRMVAIDASEHIWIDPGPPSMAQAMLKELNCPVLLIHGRQGPGRWFWVVDLDTDFQTCFEGWAYRVLPNFTYVLLI